MYGSHSAGCEAGDPGGGPLPAGTCDHVQTSSKVSGRGEEKREGRRKGRGGEKGGEEKREGRRKGRGGEEGGEEKGDGRRRGKKRKREKKCCSFIEHFCNTFTLLSRSLSHAVPDCLRVCLSDWSVLE